MGARGRSHPGVLRSFVQRWLARSFARGVCFSCVFVNECAAAVMSVLAGPLFSTRTTMMISEGSVLHSSLVIGLRGGRALAGLGRRGRQPPPSGPSPPLMASWTTNQSASYKHLHRKRTDLVLLLHPALSGPEFRSHPLWWSSFILKDRWGFAVDNAARFSCCIPRNNQWSHFYWHNARLLTWWIHWTPQILESITLLKIPTLFLYIMTTIW